jgi:hypothetical protein
MTNGGLGKTYPLFGSCLGNDELNWTKTVGIDWAYPLK